MKEADQILFERHLKNELSSDEQTSFDRRLKEETSFRSSFDLFKEMNNYLDDKSNHQTAINTLNEVHQKATKKNKSFFYLSAFLAAVALIAILYSVKTKKENTRSSRQLALYEFPDNKGTRSLTPGATTQDSAIYYFDLRKFDLSIPLFKRILNSEPNNEIAHRYLAHNYFNLTNYSAAKVHASKIIHKEKEDSLLITILMDFR